MSKNKLQKISIKIWCEGKTEQNYFESMLPTLNVNFMNIKIETLKNGNYKPIKTLLEKEKYYDKILVIIDLDRANNDRQQELSNLKNLIQTIKKSKDIFLFLTYKNFEDWLRFHFTDSAKNSRESFYEKIGKTDESDFKTNTKGLFNQITQHGGNIENAEKYFKTRIEYLFYDNTRERIVDENNIDKIQSNLYCFRKLLKEIDNSIKS